MALNNFPYTNFHALNTDWIIKVLQDYKAFLEGEQGELQEIRGLIASNLSLIGENQTAISGLDTRITTNATRISELQTALDDLGQGNLPQTLIDNILTYVRNNLPELLTPYDIALNDLRYHKMNAGMGNPFDRSDTEAYIGNSFNDIKVPGTYRVNISEGTSVTPTNAPDNAQLTRGILVVFNTNYNADTWGVNNTVQVYYEYPNMFFRVYILSGNYWTAWSQIALKSDITNLSGMINTINSQITTINNTVNGHTSSISQHTTQIGNLQTQDNAMRDMIIANNRSITDLEHSKQGTNNGTATQADFNDITTPGSYWVRPDTTTQHAPSTYTYGILNVTRSSSSVILQSLTMTNLRFTQRIFFNNAWSAWQEYTRA